MDNQWGDLIPALNAQIRHELDELRMTQAELANAVGVGAIAMNRYLMGHRIIPTPTLIKIAGVLGITPSELFGRAESRTAATP